jgi:hypothetical protein
MPGSYQFQVRPNSYLWANTGTAHVTAKAQTKIPINAFFMFVLLLVFSYLSILSMTDVTSG